MTSSAEPLREQEVIEAGTALLDQAVALRNRVKDQTLSLRDREQALARLETTLQALSKLLGPIRPDPWS